jgi:hypothetical protein
LIGAPKEKKKTKSNQNLKGKIMYRILYSLLAVSTLLISCKDSTTNSPKTNNHNVYSIAVDGCQNALNKRASSDSIQSFEFNDDSLKIIIHVTANCCPEIDRFITTTTIDEDSVHLQVQDVAKGLCNCNCPYEIQTVVKREGIDSIYFTCEYYDSLIVTELFTRE